MLRFVSFLFVIAALTAPTTAQIQKTKKTLSFQEFQFSNTNPADPEWVKENTSTPIDAYDPYDRGKYICTKPECNPPGTISYREQYDLTGDLIKAYDSFDVTPRDDGTGTLVSVIDDNPTYKFIKKENQNKKTLSLVVIIIKNKPYKILEAEYDYGGREPVNLDAMNYHIGVIRPLLQQIQ